MILPARLQAVRSITHYNGLASQYRPPRRPNLIVTCSMDYGQLFFAKPSNRLATFFVPASLFLSFIFAISGCRNRDTDSEGDSIAVESADSQPNHGATPEHASDKRESVPLAGISAVTMPRGFVGAEVCAGCHQDQHASYLNTHHSRSLHEPVIEDESTGLAFDHPKSRRSYSVGQVGDSLHHRDERYFGELPQTTDRMVISQLPVKYVMGSGAFAKGYLLEDGDYLLQSPITWYSAAEQYAIAPGYDEPDQGGFNRVINDRCLYCHAGIVTFKQQNPNKPLFHELAIGCERCHGPGAEHTDLYRRVKDESERGSIVDHKIINPTRLNRAASESVCAQCHLDSDVSVFGPGSEVWDYRPGDLLVENRLAYKGMRPEKPGSSFANHFDQMWKSQCYLQTELLSCVTCHDPHRSDLQVMDVAAFRKICHECHTDDACAKPLAERQQQNSNACTTCHMPRSSSEIPHTSTTNHLIAVYENGEPRGIDPGLSESLRRVYPGEIPLAEEELVRRDQIAKASWAVIRDREGDPAPLRRFDVSTLRTLADWSESDALSIAADVAWRRAEDVLRTQANEDKIDPLRTLSEYFAVKTLRQESEPSLARQKALEVLADKMMADGASDNAIALYEELTMIRRDARDWYNLALCYAEQRRLGDAETALQKSLQWDASYVKPYQSLSRLYQLVDPATAAQYGGMSERLMQQK